MGASRQGGLRGEPLSTPPDWTGAQTGFWSWGRPRSPMSPTARLVLLGHAAATAYMMGLIWFVHVVHYPLFAGVGELGYAAYQAEHMRLTGFVVGPPMVLEMLGALWLAFELPPALPRWMPLTGALLVFGIWASTALFSVPAHNGLLLGFDAEVHASLCDTNLLRTLLWTLRTALVGWMIARLIPTES